MRLTRPGFAFASATLLAATGISLAGCVNGSGLARLKEDAAKVLEAPPCKVRATTRVGQQWVDETVEGGVAALNWQRPRKECADAKQATAKAAVQKAAPVKKPWWKLR